MLQRGGYLFKLKSLEIRTSIDAECVWHKIAVKDLKKIEEDNYNLSLSINSKCHDCKGYVFNCKDYDSIERQRYLKEEKNIEQKEVKQDTV